MKKFIGIVTIFFTLFICYSLVFSLEQETHRFLNERISESPSSLDTYLKLNLGFSQGVNETFKNKSVYEWLGEGGNKEDDAWWIPLLGNLTRSVNHFHNPLKPWNQAGLSDIFSGISSVIWAQDNKEVFYA